MLNFRKILLTGNSLLALSKAEFYNYIMYFCFERDFLCRKTNFTIRGELSLLLVIIINSLGVVLMLHSGSGISAISSVHYAFADVLPVITLGAWTEAFSGFAGAQPDAFKQTLCAGVPVQLCCRLGLQRHD